MYGIDSVYILWVNKRRTYKFLKSNELFSLVRQSQKINELNRVLKENSQAMFNKKH